MDFPADIAQQSWLQQNETLLWSVSGLSLVLFVATLIAIPWMIVRLPADYFIQSPIRDWPTRHPAVHLALVVLKNLAGVVLFAMGVAMLILPGQGLLTMLIGITLIDFPGKRRWERWLIDHRPILHAANWIRARNLKPPLQLLREHEPPKGQHRISERIRKGA